MHWGRRGIVYQHDPRHVDLLVKGRGLEQGNTAQTPATHWVTESEAKPLGQAQHSKYRSQVARCLFFSRDRADITFIVNELCQKMSNFDQQCMAKLKKLVRYLKRERQWSQVFSYGRMTEEVTTFTDSDWADTARQSQSEGIHTQTEDHRKYVDCTPVLSTSQCALVLSLLCTVFPFGVVSVLISVTTHLDVRIGSRTALRNKHVCTHACTHLNARSRMDLSRIAVQRQSCTQQRRERPSQRESRRC